MAVLGWKLCPLHVGTHIRILRVTKCLVKFARDIQMDETRRHLVSLPDETRRHLVSLPDGTRRHLVSLPDETSRHLVSLPDETSRHLVSKDPTFTATLYNDVGEGEREKGEGRREGSAYGWCTFHICQRRRLGPFQGPP